MKYIFIGIWLIIIAIILFFIWFLFFYLQVPPLQISKDTPNEEKTKILDAYFKKLQSENKFNGTVFIKRKGDILLDNVYGYTDFKKDTPLSSKSSFRIASLSKNFTAAWIMLLKERNIIHYDDPITKYIKDFSYTTVTIRNLLQQTSGIPDIYIDLAKKNKNDISILSNKKAVDLIVNEKRKADFLPNEKFSYSNTNYIILAYIIELTSGQTFEDFMKDEFFIPLNMNSTRVWNLNSKTSNFEWKTEDFDNFEWEAQQILPDFIDGVAWDGGVFSNTNDLQIWVNFWEWNNIISKENIKEAFRVPTLNNGKKSSYWFGWFVSDKGMWHNGSWLGAKSMLIRNQESDDLIIIIDNSSNLFFQKIFQELSKIG